MIATRNGAARVEPARVTAEISGLQRSVKRVEAPVFQKGVPGGLHGAWRSARLVLL